jgi:hypothetical protein
MSRRHRGAVEEVSNPRAEVSTEVNPAPAAHVTPALVWAASRGYGRPIAHAFREHEPRSVCRSILTSHGTYAAEPNLERCHECATILRALDGAELPSVPNLEG